jgi:hypothetical protein
VAVLPICPPAAPPTLALSQPVPLLILVTKANASFSVGELPTVKVWLGALPPCWAVKVSPLVGMPVSDGQLEHAAVTGPLPVMPRTVVSLAAT